VLGQAPGPRGELATLIGWNDRAHIDDPAVCARTIYVDAFGISAVAFDLSRADQDRLYQSGRDAATAFLDTWDFAAYGAIARHPPRRRNHRPRRPETGRADPRMRWSAAQARVASASPPDPGGRRHRAEAPIARVATQV
jgi:hypothetical protein